MPAPEDITPPDRARDAHIIEFFEKNDRNVSKTARPLAMQRRSLQRFLEKSKIVVSADGEGRTDIAFGRAKRLVRLWSLMIQTGK